MEFIKRFLNLVISTGYRVKNKQIFVKELFTAMTLFYQNYFHRQDPIVSIHQSLMFVLILWQT